MLAVFGVLGVIVMADRFVEVPLYGGTYFGRVSFTVRNQGVFELAELPRDEESSDRKWLLTSLSRAASGRLL